MNTKMSTGKFQANITKTFLENLGIPKMLMTFFFQKYQSFLQNTKHSF